jgi:hypothetical protein
MSVELTSGRRTVSASPRSKQTPSDEENAVEINKYQLQAILSSILDELPLRTDDTGEISDEAIAIIRREFLNAMPYAISMALIESDDVVCQMPYNQEVISRHASVQCPVCTRYFCRRHKLSVCPKCGATL